MPIIKVLSASHADDSGTITVTGLFLDLLESCFGDRSCIRARRGRSDQSERHPCDGVTISDPGCSAQGGSEYGEQVTVVYTLSKAGDHWSSIAFHFQGQERDQTSSVLFTSFEATEQDRAGIKKSSHSKSARAGASPYDKFEYVEQMVHQAKERHY